MTDIAKCVLGKLISALHTDGSGGVIIPLIITHHHGRHEEVQTQSEIDTQSDTNQHGATHWDIV